MGQRKTPGSILAAQGRPIRHQPTQRRRRAQRSARVGAQTDCGRTHEHAGRRSRTGSPRQTVRMPRLRDIPEPAVLAGDAVGELVQVRLAHQHGPLRAPIGHVRTVRLGHRPGTRIKRRPTCRGKTLNIEEILHRQRQPPERTLGTGRLEGYGLGLRPGLVDHNERPRGRTPPSRLKGRFRQLGRRQLSGLQGGRDFTQGPLQ